MIKHSPNKKSNSLGTSQDFSARNSGNKNSLGGSTNIYGSPQKKILSNPNQSLANSIAIGKINY